MAEPEELLLRMLAQEHLACPVCGYDLHRATAARCTECGRTIELRVTVPAGVRWAWVATLLASAGEAALAVFMLLLLTLEPRMARPRLLPAGPWWDVVFYGGFLLIPAPLILLVLRRPFSRLPSTIQWAMAAILGMLMGITLVGIVRTLR